MVKNVGNLSKLAFTHPIVVLKRGLKNNWMKKLDLVNQDMLKTWTPYSCSDHNDRHKHVTSSVPSNFNIREHFDYNIERFEVRS